MADAFKLSDELDAGQAAALLGVSRRYYVDELSKRQGFPKPSTNLSQKTRRWRYADLLKVKKGAVHLKAAPQSPHPAPGNTDH